MGIREPERNAEKVLHRREFFNSAGEITASALISIHSLAAELARGEDAAEELTSDSTTLQLTASGQAAPIGLLANGLRDPLAIDRDATRFTWRSVARGRGEMQTAYQILVSSNRANLAAGTGDWWDSGRVESDKSACWE